MIPASLPLIRAENLGRSYALGNTRVDALRGINLDVEPGEFVTLMGPSGSGKTTLLHLLGCLDTPSAGRYFLDGREVNTLSSPQRAALRGEKLGFVFQSFYLIPGLTALENVALPLLYRPNASSTEAQAHAREALRQLGMADRATHHPAELSGGERQRVAIARALVNRPALLLADEPTGNLDSATGAEVMRLLVELWQSRLTIILVTHDTQVAGYAPRVLWLKDGRLIREEGAREPLA